MKIPREVKIANHIFKIKIDNKNMKANNKHGECSPSELTIRISDDYNLSHIKETLLHEIMHGIWWAYNVHDKDDEERTVTTLTVGLSQVFNDNPKIMEFLK